MQKIKVLHLELDENMGGIESFLYNLYEQIDRKKIQFDFVTRAENPAKGNELKKLGANIYKVSSLSHPFRYMRDLENIIKNGNYDVVHIHKNSCANILPFFVTNKFKDLKVYVHSHNTQPSKGSISKILHILNRKFVWNSSVKHFACSEVAGKWLYGKKRDFIVIKNGILTNRYLFNEFIRSMKRDELQISKDSFVIGNVGRFTEQKNQKRLLEIFSNLQNLKTNTVLLLIGDGDLREENEKYAKQLGLKNVYFLGVRNDIPELMMAMDVMVMPSLYEGLPIVCIEAQATGLSMFISDTVSLETKIIDNYYSFSLEDSNLTIAKELLKMDKSDKSDKSNERTICCDIIRKAGYDMKNTANTLINEYYTKKGIN